MEREPKHRGEQDRGERPEKTDPEPGRAQVHADFVANAELSVIRLLLGRHAGNVRQFAAVGQSCERWPMN